MIDIIMTAKDMGLTVIVAVRDPQSPAKRFADVAINVSTGDLDALVALCREHSVDGVFTCVVSLCMSRCADTAFTHILSAR